MDRQYGKKRKSHRDENFHSRRETLMLANDPQPNQNNKNEIEENNYENDNDDHNSDENDDEHICLTNEDEEASTTSSTTSRGCIGSENSTDDDQIESRAIDFNSSSFDASIDVLRMSQELFEHDKHRKRVGQEMKDIKISVSERPRSMYGIAKKLYDWKGSSKLSDEGLKGLLETLEWAGVKGLPCVKDILQGVGSIPEIPELGNIDTFLCFQQCAESCVVFHGEHSRDLQCGICESPRFAACATCSPQECSCLLNMRSPMKTFYCSSLIFYLRDKLSQPTAANFVMALKTEVVKVKNTHINDIFDGVRVKKALNDMDKTFEAYNKKISQNLIKLNLVLGGYYDGAQLYKNQVASFWPAGMTIFNLPPSYRFKEGVGFHLWAVFMGQTPSAAEDYLFRRCLGEELKVLKHGIVIADKYFVQARFVISVMDTKGQQHFTKFQSQASCSPCPCCGFRGTWAGKVVYTDHRKYLGWTHAYRAIGQTRKCCPEHQYSTASLNSRNLAERGRFWKNIETLHPEDSQEERYKSNFISTSTEKEGIDERKTLEKTVCNDAQDVDIKAIYSDIMADGHNFLFYHDHKEPGSDSPTFCYTDFIARMYFINCYYKDYKSGERTSETDLQERMQESDQKIFEKNRNRRRNSQKPLQELDDPENGCHGSFALADAPVSIQSFMIWDPFHVLPNVTNKLLDLFSGKIKFSVTTKDICRRVGMHRSVAEGKQEKVKEHETVAKGNETETRNKKEVEKKVKKKIMKKVKKKKKKEIDHPWQITHKNMNLLDGMLNSCMISTGYGNEYQLRYLFKQGGLLNSASKIQLLRIMAPVLAAFSGLHEAYQQFIRMLHHDIVFLFRPFFEGPEEIDRLFLLLVETVVTFEGLFPISEHAHGFHQLVCLVKQLKEFGPIRNLMSATMERCLKSIKDLNPNGGQSPYRTQLRRYLALMRQRHGQAFRFEVRRGRIKSTSPMRRVRKVQKEINDPSLVSVSRDSDSPFRIRFNDAKICLWNEASSIRCETVTMDHDNIQTFFEQSLFIEALLHEIKRQGEEGKSSLYKAFNVLLEGMKSLTIDIKVVKKPTKSQKKELEKDKNDAKQKENNAKMINRAFVCWIYFVATGCMHTLDKHVIPDPLALEKIFKKMNDEGKVDLYKPTFISIHRLFTEKVKYYRNANAYGIRINSRLASLDANFADCPDSGQRIFNESNIASSFCKYRDSKDLPRYGLCQYFFRVICPSDCIIHGMPLARTLQINTFTNDIISDEPLLVGKKKIFYAKIKMGLTGILIRNDEDHQGLALCPHNCCHFVPLTRFFSTSVILIPLDVDNKPMLHKFKRRSFAQSEQLRDKNNVVSKTNEIGMFYVIDFHPERYVYVYNKRNNGEYNNIENDY